MGDSLSYLDNLLLSIEFQGSLLILRAKNDGQIRVD